MPAFGVPFSDLPQEAQAMAYELSRRSDSELVAAARGNEGAMAASRQWLEDAHFHVRDDGELRSLASHAERLRRNRLDPIPVELLDYFGYSEPYDEQDLYSNHNLAHRKDAMTTNSKSGRRRNRSASRKRALDWTDGNPVSEDDFEEWVESLSARDKVLADEGFISDELESFKADFDYNLTDSFNDDDAVQIGLDVCEEFRSAYPGDVELYKNGSRSASRKRAELSDPDKIAETVFNYFNDTDPSVFSDPYYSDDLMALLQRFADETDSRFDTAVPGKAIFPLRKLIDGRTASRRASRSANRNRKATMTTASQTVAARKARAAALRLAADKLDPVFDRSASRRPARSAGRKRAYTVQELADEKNLDLATVLDYLGYPAGTPADEVVPDTGAEELIREARRRESARQAARRRAAMRLADRRRRAADDDAEDDFDWEEKAEEREEDEAEKEARIARRTAAIVLRSLRRQASVTRRAADVGQEDTPEDLPEVDENEQPTEADDDTADGNGVVNTVPQTDESGVDEPTADEDPLEPVSVPDPDEARQASRRPVRLSGRTASTASDDTALL